MIFFSPVVAKIYINKNKIVDFFHQRIFKTFWVDSPQSLDLESEEICYDIYNRLRNITKSVFFF